MESSYLVKGRAGPEFQIRVPHDLQAATGVTILRLKLPPQQKRELRDSVLKRAGVAKAMFEGLRGMDRDKLKTLNRAELQSLLSTRLEALNDAFASPPGPLSLERVREATESLGAVGDELFGRPAPLPDKSARDSFRWIALKVALNRARDEGKPLVTRDADDLLEQLIEKHLSVDSPHSESEPRKAMEVTPKNSEAHSIQINPETEHPVSAAFDAYRKDLLARSNPDNDHLQTIEKRKLMFVSLFGDIDVRAITNPVLREFGYAISFLPAKIARKGQWNHENLRAILKSNGYQSPEERGSQTGPVIKSPCIGEKTLVDKTIAVVKTAIFFYCGEHANLEHGLASFRFTLPDHTPRSLRRKKPKAEAVTALITAGHCDGRLVQAMLPLLAATVGRRVGLLAYLRAEHLEERAGRYLLSVKRQFWTEKGLQTLPIKTDISEMPFVLNDIFREIGFIDFIKHKQKGWIFESLHLAGIENPSGVAQKRMAALIKTSGIQETVFHQLRHLVIGEGRNSKLPADIRRKQVGHKDDDHAGYASDWEDGEIETVSNLNMPEQIPWTLFNGFDFKKAEMLCLSTATREQKRRSKKRKNR
jgi:integrase